MERRGALRDHSRRIASVHASDSTAEGPPLAAEAVLSAVARLAALSVDRAALACCARGVGRVAGQQPCRWAADRRAGGPWESQIRREHPPPNGSELWNGACAKVGDFRAFRGAADGDENQCS